MDLDGQEPPRGARASDVLNGLSSVDIASDFHCIHVRLQDIPQCC